MCSGTWMGRSRGVKEDLVGAVYMMEERERKHDRAREDAGEQTRIEVTAVLRVCKFDRLHDVGSTSLICH